MNTLTPAQRKRKLTAIKTQLNKKGTVITTADEAPNTFQYRRPSGIMQLDIDTGGGLPAGGLSVVSGPDGAGKTWLLYNYFMMHQRIYKENASILYCVVEFLPDYKYMRNVGVQVPLPDSMLDEINMDRVARDLPKLTKAERASFKTTVGSFDILRAPTAEAILDAVLKAYASNAYHIIALDSVSVMQASAEAQKDTLQDIPQQAANANLLTRFMQKFHPLTLGLEDPNMTTLISVAQARANRKKSEMPSYIGKWQKDWQPSQGAHALRHGKLIDILIHASGKDKDKKTGIIKSKTVKWELVKGKAGTHDNIVGETTYTYDDPGDHISNLVFTGMKKGVIVESEGRLTVIDRMNQQPLTMLVDGDRRTLTDIEGPQELRNIFREHLDIELRVRREILTAAGVGTCLYR